MSILMIHHKKTYIASVENVESILTEPRSEIGPHDWEMLRIVQKDGREIDLFVKTFYIDFGSEGPRHLYTELAL